MLRSAGFAGFDLVEPGLVQVPMWRLDHKALRPSGLVKVGSSLLGMDVTAPGGWAFRRA